MMNEVLLIAVNSSYVHTNLAVRALAQCAGAGWREYNINQPQYLVLKEIYEQKPRVAAFSCSIWNIEYICRLAQDIKTLLPGTKILFGGPEVSFDAREQMKTLPFVDAIVCGEAEEVIAQVLGALLNDRDCGAPGVLLRRNGMVTGDTQYNCVNKLELLKQPYQEFDPHRIYYYESSRGCPFHCAYCLSGVGIPVREKPLEQVFAELQSFAAGGAKLVKFTDRTFNANKTRALEIWKYIIENTGETSFHFEIALDLMDENALSALEHAPDGKIQLEAGVQTCNRETLDAVVRNTDLDVLGRNAKRLVETGNIHLHLDLIAGLPHENIDSFERSFNQIYTLYPHHLQLGFLKLLKGSRLRKEAEKYGIKFRQYPPYEVLETADISAQELFMLKGIDELLNRYYNTGRARGALDELTKGQGIKPFQYFKSLHTFCEQKGYHTRPVSAASQFQVLIDHAKEQLPVAGLGAFLTALKEDYNKTKVKGRMPEELERI